MIIPVIRLFILLSLWTVASVSDENYKSCRERNRLIENEKGDLYALIDATPGQKITLQCRYCEENDDGRPKIWYKMNDLGHSAPREVQLDMNNNAAINKLHVNKQHSLTVNNFTVNDTGLYYCRRLEESDQEKHNYLVDLVYDENITAVETGNFTDWRKYYEEYLVPLNILFSQSQGVEFQRVRSVLNIEMEAVTQWRPWGPCQVCGRPQNEAIRKKTGLCRIRLTHKNPIANSSTKKERFLQNANAVSCRSQVLGRLFPGISNLTRIIPSFVQVQACQGTCNPDAEGLSKGWKTGKTAAFKYRKSFVLEENSHLTLVCPESTLENRVIWKKNGKVLEAGRRVSPPKPDEEPRIMVDTFNTLYLVGVKQSEAGNYTCQVDDIRMQQIMVFVISKSKLLTQAFVRHMMYLGLVLSLSLPCYCAGIVISCSRRRKFKGYQELKEIDEEDQRHRFLTSR